MNYVGQMSHLPCGATLQPFSWHAKTCRASLDWTDEDLCPYGVRGSPLESIEERYLSPSQHHFPVRALYFRVRPAPTRHAQFSNTSSRLHRLDAGPGLRPHVSDSLLRFLAESRGPQDDVLHVVPTGRDVACALVSLSGGNFFCPRDRQA